MIWLYICSSDEQDREAQSRAMYDYMRAKGLRGREGVIPDITSKPTEWKDSGIKELLTLISPGDTVIINLPRLSSYIIGAHDVLDLIAAKGATVQSIASDPN